MIVKIDIRRISLHFVWIMGFLEFITVPLVVIIPKLTGTALKNPLHGISVGFIGMVLLFSCVNPFLSRLGIEVMGGKVKRLSVLSSAFWSALILSLIFLFQMILWKAIPFCYPWSEIILGFGSAGGAVFCTSLLYRTIVPVLPRMAISMKTTEGLFGIEQFSVLKFSIFAGIYEGVALPIISVWKFAPGCEVIVSLVSGSVGGLAGAFLLWIISLLSQKSMGWMALERAETKGLDGLERVRLERDVGK